MPYMLKKNSPAFDMVDGPDAGKKYRHGEVYTDIPRGEKGRFEEAKPAPASVAATKKKENSEVDPSAPVKAAAKKGGINK